MSARDITWPLESTTVDPDASVFTVTSGLGRIAHAAPPHPSAAQSRPRTQRRLMADRYEDALEVTS